MTKNGTILIVFAWAMEAIGVAGGVINSTYTTFGADLPGTFAGYIPAVPMVAVAVAEFGRVPLASVIYDKHKFMKAIPSWVSWPWVTSPWKTGRSALSGSLNCASNP
jgi:hypothetical protein